MCLVVPGSYECVCLQEGEAPTTSVKQQKRAAHTTTALWCFCGLGLIYSNKTCTMPSVTFQDLPLNIYIVIFGTGIFVFVLSLIFCCYFISKLRHQAQSERFGYREVILKGDPKKLNLHGQTCAVCLEDFKVKDELGVLPCQHAFHRRCVVKWLEVRCVCPMCNKPLAGSSEQHQSIGTLLDELV
uniref:RING finger protein 122 n=1 Tax=Cyprinus carpio TaxID=7962 RepID=A0A8C1Q6G0_CYPCA